MTDASKKREVALFVSCLVDQVMPEVGVATVRLLRRAGCDVHFPEAQTCCGQPFYNSGFHDQARDLARRTIEVFEPFETVVMPSGSCTAMIRREYVHLFDSEPAWKERARALAEKTFELSQFLVHQRPRPEGFDGQTPAARTPAAHADGPTVTYHDSCHACRMLGLGKEARRLLAGAGCRVTEMVESDRCCGFGGLFSIKMPEVSNAMTKEKLRQAVDTGVETLVSIDPGCLMQMRGLSKGLPLRVEHLAVVLEEQEGRREKGEGRRES